MSKTIPLTELKPGAKAVVKLLARSDMRRRWDIGLIENTPVECLGRSRAATLGFLYAARSSPCARRTAKYPA